MLPLQIRFSAADGIMQHINPLNQLNQYFMFLVVENPLKTVHFFIWIMLSSKSWRPKVGPLTRLYAFWPVHPKNLSRRPNFFPLIENNNGDVQMFFEILQVWKLPSLTGVFGNIAGDGSERRKLSSQHSTKDCSLPLSAPMGHQSLQVRIRAIAILPLDQWTFNGCLFPRLHITFSIGMSST